MAGAIDAGARPVDRFNESFKKWGLGLFGFYQRGHQIFIFEK